MNERILELAKQAGMEPDELDENEGIIWWLGNSDLQKFAELIVRECADIAYGYDAPKMSGPGMIIAGMIETHFGVEE